MQDDGGHRMQMQDAGCRMQKIRVALCTWYQYQVHGMTQQQILQKRGEVIQLVDCGCWNIA